VGRPHGKEGGFVVNGPTERVDLLETGRQVVVGGRELTVEWRKGTAERPLVKLAGADVAELRGLEMTVPRQAIGTLGEGEFLVADLVGCEAWDGPRRLGRVREVLLLPSVDVLEVERAEGEEPLLVPLVADAVRSVDVAARRIDVDSGFIHAD
jgi:16S rRNA processing protein RimM